MAMKYRPRYWILVHDKPIASNALEWAKWFAAHAPERFIARTKIGTSEVSTVFLGLDHNFAADGPPILYETMVFGGALDQEQQRYHTGAEARTGHARMVARVQTAELSSS